MTNSKQSSLVFSNSYGLLFADRIYLQRENALSCFYIENLKSVKLTKTQEKKVNIFSLLGSVLILCIATLYIENDLAFMITSYVIAAVFILMSFTFKKYLYTIIILTNANDFISIKVNTDMKYAAKEFVTRVNKELKENDRFLRVE